MNLLTISPKELEALRETIRKDMEFIVPAGELDVITNLVIEAVDQGLKKADEVLASAPSDNHYVSALGPTASLLCGQAEYIREAVSRWALQSGVVSKVSRVTIGAQ